MPSSEEILFSEGLVTPTGRHNKKDYILTDVRNSDFNITIVKRFSQLKFCLHFLYHSNSSFI
jgi:hypothetical protein